MRISDWSSDVCSSDLLAPDPRVSVLTFPNSESESRGTAGPFRERTGWVSPIPETWDWVVLPVRIELTTSALPRMRSTTELRQHVRSNREAALWRLPTPFRSEEHTSELQSLMRISYA